MVKTRIEWKLEHKQILNKLQFGFRKGKGINDSLTILSSIVGNGFSQGIKTMIGFLDMKGAYDHVNVDVLMTKFIELGIHQDICMYIKNILSNRRIYVNDFQKNRLVGPGFTNKGLAQGFPLAPLLFNVYINNLKDFISDGVIMLQYADGIVLAIQGHNLNMMADKMNETLANLETWLQETEISFSPLKSACMLFQNKAENGIPVVRLHDVIIPWVEKFKYLGVIFDKGYTWKNQVEMMCAKAIKGTNVMKFFAKTWWGSHPLLLYILVLLHPSLC
ncbi:uncharacterized protein LOC115874486 [Sitophilus oryzae]|uniref:Uncharacterized protein LOC115874486 n=1 Tax=Sitophilus oryzae TaxID=7048 RepID=A0A6J2X2N4_SITOR|nr:uncharacterized protein LOC115874486 [Sitophilus oryzae]